MRLRDRMSASESLTRIAAHRYTDFERWRSWFSLGENWKSSCGLKAKKLPGPPSKLPDFAAARWQALRPGGPVTTRFLSRQPTLLRVGGTLFAHGGALPEHIIVASLDDTNRSVQQWMLGQGKRQPSITRGRDSVVWSRHFRCVCACSSH